jgi:WhiB family redox-sensing transcriptional regulator
MSENDWRLEAECRGMDPNFFFPPRGSNKQYREVVKVCQVCPVQEECLDYAIRHSIDGRYGIWGGKSERQRRLIKHERNLAYPRNHRGAA